MPDSAKLNADLGDLRYGVEPDLDPSNVFIVAEEGLGTDYDNLGYVFPTAKLRTLEKSLNDVFALY